MSAASDAIQALSRIKMVVLAGGAETAPPGLRETLDADFQTIARYVVERNVSEAPPENTGLPCPYCDQKLKQLVARREDDGSVTVQLSVRVQPKELSSMLVMLNQFAR